MTADKDNSAAPLPVLVFRPEADAIRTAAALDEAGYVPIIAPLFRIEASREPCPRGPYGAVLLTSANAVPPLDLPRATPVLAVGEQTGAAARQAGFTDVRVAKGDRRSLAALVRERLPASTPLLAALGEDHHADWLADLEREGYPLTRWIAYAALAEEELPLIARAAMGGQPRPVALHFSRRGAEVFLNLAGKAALGEQARAMRHVAISEEVRQSLADFGCAHVATAAEPNAAGVIAALGALTQLRLDIPAAAGKDAASAPHHAVNRDGTGQESAGVTKKDAKRAAADAEAALPEPVAVTITPEEATPAAEAAQQQDTASGEPVRAPRGPGWPGVVAAGLVGGVVGAGALYLAQTRLGDLGARLGLSASAPAPSPASDAADKRLSSLEQALAAADARAKAAMDQARQAQAAAQQAAEAASKPPAASPAAAPPDLAAITERMARLESAGRAAAPGQDAGSAAARLLLADRLRLAIEAGLPFEAPLRGLTAAGAESEALSRLAPLAARGVPSRAALRDLLRAQRRALAQDNAAMPTSLTERILALAGRVVSIRKLEGGEPSTPAALVEALDAALTSGKDEEALKSWQALPEPARRASETLGAGLAQRVQATTALKRIDDAAIAALSAR